MAYKCLYTDPFSFEECSALGKAACGLASLDFGFENLLRRRLGLSAALILNAKVKAETLKKFDSIKRRFNPFDGDCETEYEIPLRGAPEMPHIGLEEGHLKLTMSIHSSLFCLFAETIFKIYLNPY